MLKYLEGDFKEMASEEVTAMIAALSAEAKLTSQLEIDRKDADVIAEGRDLIMDDFASGCTDCHKFHGEGTKGIDLTGYGSREWQFKFIKNPIHFYGKRNDRMPIFGPKLDEEGRVVRPATLTDVEIGHIIDWMRGEWWKLEEGQ